MAERSQSCELLLFSPLNNKLDKELSAYLEMNGYQVEISTTEAKLQQDVAKKQAAGVTFRVLVHETDSIVVERVRASIGVEERNVIGLVKDADRADALINKQYYVWIALRGEIYYSAILKMLQNRLKS